MSVAAARRGSIRSRTKREVRLTGYGHATEGVELRDITGPGSPGSGQAIIAVKYDIRTIGPASDSPTHGWRIVALPERPPGCVGEKATGSRLSRWKPNPQRADKTEEGACYEP